jgi:hypothetical protein
MRTIDRSRLLARQCQADEGEICAARVHLSAAPKARHLRPAARRRSMVNHMSARSRELTARSLVLHGLQPLLALLILKWRAIVFTTGGSRSRRRNAISARIFSASVFMIDERQFPSAALPKNLVHQCDIGRPPSMELRRFIQPLPQSLDPPDELDLLGCNVSELNKLIAVR